MTSRISSADDAPAPTSESVKRPHGLARTRLPCAESPPPLSDRGSAAERRFDVLHQDRHFDTLATVLGFPSVRLTN